MKFHLHHFLMIIFLAIITTTSFAMCDCRELIGTWIIRPDNIKDWKCPEGPEVIITGVKYIPGTHGYYNLSGCINGHIMVDSKCIEQYGHVQTVSLISKEFFFRSNAPDPLVFFGFYRAMYRVPHPPIVFGLI
jgi:hypothetical protein